MIMSPILGRSSGLCDLSWAEAIRSSTKGAMIGQDERRKYIYIYQWKWCKQVEKTQREKIEKRKRETNVLRPVP